MKKNGLKIKSRLQLTEKEDVTGALITVFKRLISEGTLTPGARLPAERELATAVKHCEEKDCSWMKL